MKRTKDQGGTPMRRCQRMLLWCVGGLLAAGLSAAVAGCLPLTGNVLVNDAGEAIRLGDIFAITGDDTLTDAEKREQLEILGVTDDDLLDLFL